MSLSIHTQAKVSDYSSGSRAHEQNYSTHSADAILVETSAEIDYRIGNCQRRIEDLSQQLEKQRKMLESLRQFHGRVSQDIRALYKDFDVAIVLDDGTCFYGHSHFLAIHHDYFAQVLLPKAQNQIQEIRVPNCSEKVFEKIFSYLHTGELQLSEEYVIELLETAHGLWLFEFQEQCQKYIYLKLIVPEKIAALYCKLLSFKSSCPAIIEVTKWAIKMICLNPVLSLMPSNDKRDLRQWPKDILIHMLNFNELWLKEVVFDMVCQWVETRIELMRENKIEDDIIWQDLRELTEELFACARWKCFATKYLQNKMSKNSSLGVFPINSLDLINYFQKIRASLPRYLNNIEYQKWMERIHFFNSSRSLTSGAAFIFQELSHPGELPYAFLWIGSTLLDDLLNKKIREIDYSPTQSHSIFRFVLVARHDADNLTFQVTPRVEFYDSSVATTFNCHFMVYNPQNPLSSYMWQEVMLLNSQDFYKWIPKSWINANSPWLKHENSTGLLCSLQIDMKNLST